MKLYRIEHLDTKAGMWHNFDGSYNGIIKTLTEGKSKNVPMARTKLQDTDGKKWFSAVKSIEQLLDWFTVLDIEELMDLGYGLYEIECKEYISTENETIFTRDSITRKTLLNIASIFGLTNTISNKEVSYE